MPFKTGLIYTYDSGEFEKDMRRGARCSPIGSGFAPARRAAAKSRGKLHGVGLASVIEIAGGPAEFRRRKRRDPLRRDRPCPRSSSATHSHGQGHETVYRQMARHLLGLAPEHVAAVYGDTDLVYPRPRHLRLALGHGRLGAAFLAAAKIIEKGKTIAGHAPRPRRSTSNSRPMIAQG